MPAINSKNTLQKAQQIHILCLSFFFWRASHESLWWGASADIVVTNLKREAGRPESGARERVRERVERFGVRKKEREGGRGSISICGGVEGGCEVREG